MDQGSKIDFLCAQFWERQWSRALQNSTISMRKRDDPKWMKFWDIMSEYYDFSEELPEKLINFLLKEGIINRKSKILDIGCGVGTFTIPFSRKTSSVVALDPSQKMLEKISQKIEIMKIKNITLVNSKWEEFDETKKFDLVFAAFCPAVNNGELLMKMKSMTKKYACLVTYAKSDSFSLKIRNGIWMNLTKKPFISQSFHIIYPFNFLYSAGFRPQIKSFSYNHTIDRNFDDIVSQFESYFDIFLHIDEMKREKIRHFLRRFAKKDRFIFKNKGEVYAMWW